MGSEEDKKFGEQVYWEKSISHITRWIGEKLTKEKYFDFNAQQNWFQMKSVLSIKLTLILKPIYY